MKLVSPSYYLEMVKEVNELASPDSLYTYAYKNASNYFGKNATGTKILYVPVNSTGYDEGIWQSELIEKCGFVLSKTL